MSSIQTELRISKLPRRQVSALKRKAEQMGLSADEYVKQLIENDLALDRRARSSPLRELAAPFRKALKGAGEKEISRIVEKSRR